MRFGRHLQAIAGESVANPRGDLIVPVGAVVAIESQLEIVWCTIFQIAERNLRNVPPGEFALCYTVGI
jgi:hypothetical protein